MASHIGVPLTEYSSRPSLRRSRSHSTPEQNAATSQQPQSAVERPTRPIHGRSQSYLSPIAPKPRNAAALPSQTTAVEKASSRLHLPGKHHLHRDRDGERRGLWYTQSEVEHQSSSRLRKRDEKNHHRDRDREADSLPYLVAGLNAERRRAANTSDEKQAHSHARGHGHGHAQSHSHDAPVHSAVPAGLGLTRMMSSRSHRERGNTAEAVFGDAYAGRHYYGRTGYSDRNELRRRATSDPKKPTNVPQQGPGQRTRNPIELDLERAERLKRQRKFTLTQSDILRKDRELAEAEEEMRSTLEDINRSGIEITRRLDYGYYNLLEKVGNLVGTIQSFRTLAEQSRQLLENFDTEAERLNADTRRRIDQSKLSFEERSERVEKLVWRGKAVANKAEDLNTRLENARVVLDNWSTREDQVKKVWRRAWGGAWATLAGLVILVLAVGVGRGWWVHGTGDALDFSHGGWNGSGSLRGGEGAGAGAGVAGMKGVDVPEDVRLILEGIEERNRRRNSFIGIVGTSDDAGGEMGKDVKGEMGAEAEDKLRVLDEL